MTLFHSKNYKNMMKLMNEKGFFKPNIEEFNINSLSAGIKKANGYETFMIVVS